MYRYNIMTEAKNVSKVVSICKKSFNNFTISKTVGYWKGKREKSLVIDLVIAHDGIKNINRFAKTLKALNEQEAMLVTKEKIYGHLV